MNVFGWASKGQWSDWFAEANGYLDLRAKLVSDEALDLKRETHAEEFYESLSPQAKALVDLGRHSGGRVESFTIADDPLEALVERLAAVAEEGKAAAASEPVRQCVSKSVDPPKELMRAKAPRSCGKMAAAGDHTLDEEN